MLTRRGFLGALTAIAATPRRLFARATRQVRSTVPAESLGPYFYKVTYITTTDTELVPPMETPPPIGREIYRAIGDGPYVRIGTAHPEQSHFIDEITAEIP